MGDLKPISHKQFNEFIKGKGFKGRNDYVPTHLDSLARFDSESKWAGPNLTPFGPVCLYCLRVKMGQAQLDSF